ncbi:hypothetical protein QL285_061414 [Trifolium repens]|nr:hypothetical protein QL285_061414 [Trifolium repens]
MVILNVQYMVVLASFSFLFLFFFSLLFVVVVANLYILSYCLHKKRKICLQILCGAKTVVRGAKIRSKSYPEEVVLLRGEKMLRLQGQNVKRLG